MKTIKIIFNLIGKNNQKFYNIQFLWILNSLFQTLSVYGYAYLLSMLTSELTENKILATQNLYLPEFLKNLQSLELVILILLLSIFSNFYHYFVLKISNEFYCLEAEKTQFKLFRKYISMDYQNFLYGGVIKKISTILLDSQKLYGLYMSFGTLLFNLSTLLIIFLLLLVIDYQITLISFLFLLFLYLISTQLSKIRFKKNSKNFSFFGKDKVDLINKSFAGFREVKIYGLERLNLIKFNEVTAAVAYSKSSTTTLSYAPRFFIEPIFFICIGIFYFLITNFIENPDKFLGYLLVLIVAFSRLIPSFQAIYIFFSVILDANISMKKISEELRFKNEEAKSNFDKFYKNKKNLRQKKLNDFSKKLKIQFQRVNFSYDKDKNKILKDLNLVIESGDKIFLKGKSGSGKSTFLDIFTGLLKVSSGQILFNGERYPSFKNKNLIGYSSQTPFLYNSSILENVTFKKNRDLKKKDISEVNKLIRMLELTDLIKNKNDLIKKIGDFGSEISGGQKQRLSIARALYLNPKILILDESLSAVDFEKRTRILKNILKIMKNKIVIFVSHETENIKYFNKLFLINDLQIIQKKIKDRNA